MLDRALLLVCPLLAVALTAPSPAIGPCGTNYSLASQLAGGLLIVAIKATVGLHQGRPDTAIGSALLNALIVLVPAVVLYKKTPRTFYRVKLIGGSALLLFAYWFGSVAKCPEI